MKKAWGGRFSKQTDSEVLEFNSAENTAIDAKLVPYDIEGSIAHVKMLEKQKIITKQEAHAVTRALNEILGEWKSGKFSLDPGLEDVHMNIEAAVIRKTAHGKKMHTARSRNDQVNLDMRLYMRDQIDLLVRDLGRLRQAFRKQGKKKTSIPAHTHTRVAQPITNAMWGNAYTVSFGKDIRRAGQLRKRINKNPLGACAVAGTGWNIDRSHTAKLLGFNGVEENELETISSRGEIEAEFAFLCSMIATRLSRIAEDLIWLSYVGLVQLPEEQCTGSSIMPNKINPDSLELVRGRSARVQGNLVALLAMMKGTPTGHNADSQESKKAVMDSIDTTRKCIIIMSRMIEKISWDRERGEQLIREGYGRATLLADRLCQGGMPFREAHEKVGRLIKKLQKQGRFLEDLDEEEIRAAT